MINKGIALVLILILLSSALPVFANEQDEQPKKEPHTVRLYADNHYTVWFLSEDGGLVQISSAFDAAAGVITFTTHHSGIFVLDNAHTSTPSTPTGRRVVRFTIGSTAYVVNGVVRAGDAAPFICTIHDRTMIPLRAVATALGVDVRWIPETRTVLVYVGETAHELLIDVPLAGDMGTPVIIDDRTFVPLRYVSALLSAEVRWDPDNRAAYFYEGE